MKRLRNPSMIAALASAALLQSGCATLPPPPADAAMVSGGDLVRIISVDGVKTMSSFDALWHGPEVGAPHVVAVAPGMHSLAVIFSLNGSQSHGVLWLDACSGCTYSIKVSTIGYRAEFRIERVGAAL